MKVILIIEDIIELRENIAEILRLDGYEVLMASNGRSGISIAKEKKPDLIICDVTMPGMNGFDVLAEISQCSETAKIPFVFLTSRADSCDRCKGLDLGADDYLIKPFDAEGLLSTIRNRIKKNECNKSRLEQQQEQLITELKKMLFEVSHKIRNPICTSLGLISLLNMENYEMKEIQQIMDLLKAGVLEMDSRTKELTVSLYNTLSNYTTHSNKDI